jgi:uncharacterized membrane protein YukC
MKKKEEHIIDKRNYFIVNYGIGIIVLTSLATLFLLYVLKLNDRPLLYMVLDFYQGHKLQH